MKHTWVWEKKHNDDVQLYSLKQAGNGQTTDRVAVTVTILK